MSLLAGAAVLVLLAAAGWWPAVAWRRGTGSRAERLALALALGAALTGLVQVALSVAGVRTTVVVPAALAVLSVAGARRRRQTAIGGGERVPAAADGRPGRPLAALLALVLAVATTVSVGLPFRSDGGKFWAPRARELARVSAREDPALHDPARLAFHREYPLLVPALMAPAFGLSPRGATTGPKLVLAGLLAALLVLLVTTLARRGPPGRLLAAAFLAMPALTSLESRESIVAAGFVDAVLALFLLLVIEAVERLRRGEGVPGDRLAAGVLGAALVATKLEGGVALALVLGAWLVVGPRRGGWPAVLGTALLLSVPTLWLHLRVTPDAALVQPGLLLDGGVLLARGPVVLAGLLGLLVDASVFGLLPLVLLACLPGASRRGADCFGLLLLGGLVAFLATVYLATSMHLGRHLFTSAHRLLLQWLPVFALLVAGRPRPGALADGR